MEAIRQNGKIILHSNDGISIKMIFRNLTGKNFQVRSMRTIFATSQSGACDLRPASSSIAGTVKLSLNMKISSDELNSLEFVLHIWITLTS